IPFDGSFQKRNSSEERVLQQRQL
ncbi:hypothetical protein CCACVL1_29163, partial [Corchorus capsularis]